MGIDAFMPGDALHDEVMLMVFGMRLGKSEQPGMLRESILRKVYQLG
jgi:hypothetical protein